MARASVLCWFDRLLTVVLLATLVGCRGAGAPLPADSAEGAAPFPLSGLPALTPVNETPRAASYSNVLYAAGNGIFDSSGGLIFAGNSVVIPSAANGVAWARYGFNTGGYHPDTVSIDLSTGNGGSAWVGVADFGNGHWRLSGPYTNGATIQLPTGDYLSTLDQFYVVVIAYGGTAVTVNSVIASYENGVPAEFSISGTLTDEQGAPLPGVSVMVSPGFQSVYTDLEGEYLLVVPSAGMYTVEPQDPSSVYSAIDPPNDIVDVNGNETGIDFQLTRIDITGRIADANGAGIPGVQVMSSMGPTTYTDGDGRYIFPGADPGMHTLTPMLTGYAFDPPTLNANVSVIDVLDQDFEATGGQPTYTISGLILDGANPVEGVAVTLQPGYRLDFTDSNGFYSFSGLSDNVTYTVTPAKGNYTFTPPVQPVVVDGASVPNQDFAATPPPPGYLVAGQLIDPIVGGEAVPNVTARLYRVSDSKLMGTDISNSAGVYSFFDIPDGTYELTLDKFDYDWNNGPFFVTVAGGDTNIPDISGQFGNGPTWDNFGNHVISTWCIQCHRPDSQTAVDPYLRSYDEVEAAGIAVENTIDGGSMPPEGALSEYYQLYFQLWRDAGFPES
jgi:hypothetical protein